MRFVGLSRFVWPDGGIGVGDGAGRRHAFLLDHRALLPGAALAAGCSRLPDLGPGETGRIARVSNGDALTLDTGVKVSLAQVEAPRSRL